MLPYPAIADGLDEPTNSEKLPSRSPFVGSELVTQAGPFVGAMIASRLFAASVSLIAAWAIEVACWRGATQSALGPPPVGFVPTINCEVPGPSRVGWALLKSIKFWRVIELCAT